MKGKNKIYTAEDFARYHAGTMPASEMHVLEKAALEDPFLEDALEGYRHSAAVEDEVEELRSRLAEKRKKKNVFFISSFAQNKWWRIAVLFIVIAGAGYIFYRANYSNKENTLAKNEIKTPPEKKDSTTSITIDTATTKNDVAFENQQASKFAYKGKALSTAKPRIEKEVAPEKMKSLSVPLPADIPKDGFYSDSISINNSDKETEARVAPAYVLKGKVTDDKGTVVPFANISDETHHKVTVTDAEGRFLLLSPDSSITATASAAGFNSKSFKLKKDLEATIAMNKANANLSAVTVTAYGQSKKLKESRALNGEVTGVQVTSSGPQPSGGREKFDQYLKENTAPVYDENNDRLRGEVLLSFTINKKGRPENIKVLKSSCEACEQEAIKLLENGPRWMEGKNKTGTVEIKF